MLIENALDAGHLPLFDDADMSQENLVLNARKIKYLQSISCLHRPSVVSKTLFIVPNDALL